MDSRGSSPVAATPQQATSKRGADGVSSAHGLVVRHGAFWSRVSLQDSWHFGLGGTMAHNPSAWTAYRALVRDGAVAPNSSLNRFAGRYSMARQFVAVEFAGTSAATSDAYAAGLRVGLAYSTLESLTRALRLGKNAVTAKSPQLATALKDPKFASFHEYLLTQETGDDSKLIGEIERFLANRSTDLRPVAARVRHMMFHGRFTAHGSQVARSKALRGHVHELADCVLDAVDARFTVWVSSRRADE